MSESNDEQLTVDDILQEAEQADYHTILELWRGVIGPASKKNPGAKVTPQWATRIVNTYPGLHFSDMVAFRDLFYDRVAELANILNVEIETDDECLKRTTPEEDALENRHHYINTITLWQKAALLWELDWDSTSPSAAIDVAAISEIHKMFFEQNGLISLLDNINLEFSDDDRQTLTTELEELRQAVEG